MGYGSTNYSVWRGYLRGKYSRNNLYSYVCIYKHIQVRKISGKSLSIIVNLPANCHIHILLCDLYKKHELVVLMVGIRPTPSSFDKRSWQQTQMSGFQHLKGQSNFGMFEKETIKQLFLVLGKCVKVVYAWTYDDHVYIHIYYPLCNNQPVTRSDSHNVIGQYNLYFLYKINNIYHSFWKTIHYGLYWTILKQGHTQPPHTLNSEKPRKNILGLAFAFSNIAFLHPVYLRHPGLGWLCFQFGSAGSAAGSAASVTATIFASHV